MWFIKMTCTVFAINSACYYQVPAEASISKNACIQFLENYTRSKKINPSNIKYECAKIAEVP